MATTSDQASSTPSPEALIAELESRLAETERLQALLVDAEQRASSVPQLQQRVGELDAALVQARREAAEARTQARELDERLMRSAQALVDMQNSPSWQVTKPLRRAKQLLR